MMLENRSKTFHLSMHIDSFIAQSRYPDDYQNLMVQEGRDLTPAEARTFFALEKAKGRIVIPCSSECGNPCKHSDAGCTGFDHTGGGCPGHYSATRGSDTDKGGD